MEEQNIPYTKPPPHVQFEIGLTFRYGVRDPFRGTHVGFLDGGRRRFEMGSNLAGAHVYFFFGWGDCQERLLTSERR